MGDYVQSVGFLLLGVFINTYLFGLVSSQFITYYSSGFKDPLWIRIMVVVLIINDTFHSLSLIYMVWVYCVVNFANPEALQYALWPHTLTPILNSIVMIIANLFLGYRVYRLTKSTLLYGFLSVLAMSSFVAACILGVRAWIIHVFAKFSVLIPLITCSITLQVAEDLLLCGFLITSLYASRTRFERTNTIISRLMHVAIQSGVFCTIFALGTLITFRVTPQSSLFCLFAFPAGRIYTNTLMDTLNVRHGLRDILNETRAINISVAVDSRLHQNIPNNRANALAVRDTALGETSVVFAHRKELSSSPCNTDFVSSKENPDADCASGLPT